MPTLYDEVLYPNLPFGQTHPDRLAAIATLFGMDPAPLPRCRVLEVGCGSGENIIPIAHHYPGARFLGIDAAEVAIGAGNREIAALGLANIHLQACDIMDAPDALGEFDFVIAHGFYSWVPEPVRDKLMAMLRASLAPHGVAYISYNALPGGRIRQMFRDMMLFNIGEATELDARVQAARQMVQLFMTSQPNASQWPVVQAQAESIMERRPQGLYHDELSEVYQPSYFRDFAAHAARFGLQFLSEANYHDMQPGKLPAAAVAEVDRLAGGDRILRDQYYDFLKCRMFRQTLLCRQEIALPPAARADRVQLLHVSSGSKPVSPHPDLTSGVSEEFRAGFGGGVTTSHPFSKAVMLRLSQVWPETLSFSDLLDSASSLAPLGAGAENLANILLAIYSAGVIELHAEPAQCVSRVSDRPMVGELARSQARRGRLITTSRHTTIEPGDEKARQLIGLLDGAHDIAALARELGADPAGVRSKVELLAETGVLVG